LHLSRKTQLVLELILLVLALVLLLYFLRPILAPFFVGLVIVYLLEPWVSFLQGYRCPRTLAIVIIYIFLAGIGVLVVFFLFPSLFAELNHLMDFIPQYTADVSRWLGQWQQRYDQSRLPLALRQVIDDALANLQTEVLRNIREIIQGMLGLFSAVFSLILGPILAFYILRDLEDFRRRGREFCLQHLDPEILGFLQDVDRVTRGFIRGQVVVAAIVGIMVATVLQALGIKFALLIGIIAGVTDIIPYFGPIIGAAPAVALAGTRSGLFALEVALIFVLIHQVESAIIGPKIVGEGVGLHPVAVIFSLLVGGHFWGLWGMLISVPVAGILRVVVKRSYAIMVKRWLR